MFWVFFWKKKPQTKQTKTKQKTKAPQKPKPKPNQKNPKTKSTKKTTLNFLPGKLKHWVLGRNHFILEKESKTDKKFSHLKMWILFRKMMMNCNLFFFPVFFQFIRKENVFKNGTGGKQMHIFQPSITIRNHTNSSARLKQTGCFSS